MAKKKMRKKWERMSPGRVETIFKAMGKLEPSQLADRSLFDFASLRIDAQPESNATGGWLVGSTNSRNKAFERGWVRWRYCLAPGSPQRPMPVSYTLLSLPTISSA